MAANYPMRIQIDRHSNVGAKPDGRTYWVVSPGNGFADQPGGSYRIEIKHDYSPDPDRITRVFSMHGERFEIYSSEGWGKLIEATCEHEGTSEEEADYLQSEKYNRIPARRLAASLGGDPAVFDQLEAAWHAANVFIDFGVTR